MEPGWAVTAAQLQASDTVAARWPELPGTSSCSAPRRSAPRQPSGGTSRTPPHRRPGPAPPGDGGVGGLSGPQGRREVPLEPFFLAYRKVDLRHGEVLLSVRIPDPPPGSRVHLEKVAKRRFDDIASASLAVRLDPDPAGILTDLRIAAGGVAPIPLLLTRTADALRGTRPESATIRRAVAVLADEITPIDDVRGSAAYKRALLGHLLVAALTVDRPDLAAEVLDLPGPRDGSGGRRTAGTDGTRPMSADTVDLLVRGAARFTADLPLPAGGLHAMVAVSPHAHATFTHLDTAAAAGLPGSARCSRPLMSLASIRSARWRMTSPCWPPERSTASASRSRS